MRPARQNLENTTWQKQKKQLWANDWEDLTQRKQILCMRTVEEGLPLGSRKTKLIFHLVIKRRQQTLWKKSKPNGGIIMSKHRWRRARNTNANPRNISRTREGGESLCKYCYVTKSKCVSMNYFMEQNSIYN